MRVVALARQYWRVWLCLALLLSYAATASAQPSPWESVAARLATTFTGSLARSLALVALVVGGLMFMYGESGAKRQLAGIVFGGGIALFASTFLGWLFPGGGTGTP